MAALAAGGEAPSMHLRWHFSQVFGEHQPGDEVQQGASASRVCAVGNRDS